jgi:hypothetical protein
VNIGPGAQQSGFGKVAQETFGRFTTRPMTRDEALKILSIEETAEIDPKKVMEVSYILKASALYCLSLCVYT